MEFGGRSIEARVFCIHVFRSALLEGTYTTTRVTGDDHLAEDRETTR